MVMRMAAAPARTGFRLDREGGPVEHAECGDGVLSEYVARAESGYYVAGTRVSLDSIVYAFLEGQTAEAIAQAFPVLTLEQVYGALTYYLAHREQVDAYRALNVRTSSHSVRPRWQRIRCSTRISR